MAPIPLKQEYPVFENVDLTVKLSNTFKRMVS